MKFTVRPISDRTPFGHGEHKNSPFTVTWSTAEDLLDRELFYLGAHNVALELDVAEHAIRNDGSMRADAKVHSPAVRLAFSSNQGALIYATDRFVKPNYRRNGMQRDWQHNLYAIALGLEALRRVDRYEITQRGEQYAGFKALPAGRPMGATSEPPMPRDAAARVVALMAEPDADPDRHALLVELIKADGLPPVEANLRADTIRRAKRKAHPDHHAGNHDRWNTLAPALAAIGAS